MITPLQCTPIINELVDNINNPDCKKDLNRVNKTSTPRSNLDPKSKAYKIENEEVHYLNSRA